ncbi:MAG: hypothetical protein O3B01_24285 [Planctomycetota bacterium]|nr:hypothetical protein [Planctomycetota bacterium]MDA1141694.1 hypothetical protein [Planctomycetota bacterium]
MEFRHSPGGAKATIAAGILLSPLRGFSVTIAWVPWAHAQGYMLPSLRD